MKFAKFFDLVEKYSFYKRMSNSTDEHHTKMKYMRKAEDIKFELLNLVNSL